ncbi:MAG: prepilin-type N-terminal cleavage/methylation domain-containing protein [Lachnospiraceae bacterium]|nr:prepilin-type N-terminal cleavage/methylation domain-containing protein [Lachnospiraceae bacterium]
MKKNRKGFTLAELLIVVAIIAVLVAIAIPVFTTQLEKSREATDIANVRSAYATVVAAYLVDGEEPEAIEVQAKQTVAGWQTDNGGQIEFMDGEKSGTYSYEAKTSGDSYTVGIKVDENGNVTPDIN